MDDHWESEIIEYGAINITGFRLLDMNQWYVKHFLSEWKNLDPSTSPGAGKDTISAQAALMHDAVLVLVETFNKLLWKKPEIFKTNIKRTLLNGNSSMSNVSPAQILGLDCNSGRTSGNQWEHGEKISRFLRKIKIDLSTCDCYIINPNHKNYTFLTAYTYFNNYVVIVSANQKLFVEFLVRSEDDNIVVEIRIRS